jgi:hypothetical protein
MHLTGTLRARPVASCSTAPEKLTSPVRHNDRNVFIGECKFWAGQKAFTGAVDQLNGYLVFRDTKAAIVLSSDRRNPPS